MKKLIPALLLSVAGALIAYKIAAYARERRALQDSGRARYGREFDAYQQAGF